MDVRTERILVETERYRIAGTITLPRDGYRSRLSDFLNAPERDFISLIDVELQVLDSQGAPGTAVKRDFVAVSRHHLVLVTPLPPAEADGPGATPAAATSPALG